MSIVATSQSNYIAANTVQFCGVQLHLSAASFVAATKSVPEWSKTMNESKSVSMGREARAIYPHYYSNSRKRRVHCMKWTDQSGRRRRVETKEVEDEKINTKYDIWCRQRKIRRHERQACTKLRKNNMDGRKKKQKTKRNKMRNMFKRESASYGV